VPDLCTVEAHPGLVHLVSTVTGRLRPGAAWADVLAAAFPPGSVTGAPKLAALDVIAELEPVPRGPYCGAIGWVDADRRQGDLNVAIRTFWLAGGELHLGTGGGITWDSTPAGEWEETELKARRLLAVAAVSENRAMARLEKGDEVIITEGDFKGERGAITDKDLLGDGITVALAKNGKEIKTEEGHVNLVR
jgi:anthranilate/para-aminobenzoate synthase component I